MDKISRRKIMTSAASAAIGAGVAVPIAAAASSDTELVELGKQLDALYRRARELGEMLDPFYREEQQKMLEFEDEHGGRRAFFNRYGGKLGGDMWMDKKIEIERAFGPVFATAEIEHDQTYDAIAALARRVMELPAHGLAGLAVKARGAMRENERLWDRPIADLDWPDEFLRDIIESVLKMAGEPLPAGADA